MSTQANALAVAPPQRNTLRLIQKYGVVAFLALLILFFFSQNAVFLSFRNITNVLTEVSIYGIISIGMTYVVLTSGIDLSVGAILAFVSMTGAFAATSAWGGSLHGGSWLLSLAVCCGLGALIGFLQGRIVTALRVPPFIVTLGGLTVWRGSTLVLSDGSPISGFDASYLWWGRGAVFGLPVPVLIFALVSAAGFVALHYTRYGRRIYAVGGNQEAARLAGLDVSRLIASVYLISGLLAGLAGFLLSARLDSAEAIAGEGYELRVIASVVIGGTSLFGGTGGVAGTIVGALLIGVLLNGLVMMNVSAYYQQIIVGIIIVLAVGFDTYTKRRG